MSVTLTLIPSVTLAVIAAKPVNLAGIFGWIVPRTRAKTSNKLGGV
jgi:hypothetical protein